MEDLYTKLELVTDKFVTFVFVFLFVLQGILTSLLLFLVLLTAASHLSTSCIVSCGMRSLPFFGAGLKEESLAKYTSTIHNVGIYVVSEASPPPPSSHEDDAMKPLYNSKFQNVDGHVMNFNTRLAAPWMSDEWGGKVGLSSDMFSDMARRGVADACAMTLCIGAGKGHDVQALMRMGISDTGESDLVRWPPLVVEGDMQSFPFPKDTFDFEFWNVFDRSLFTPQLAMEVARTLKPGGWAAMRLMRGDSQGHQSSNLHSIDALIVMFEGFEVVHIGDIDACRGLDTEVIIRKPCAAGWGM